MRPVIVSLISLTLVHMNLSSTCDTNRGVEYRVRRQRHVDHYHISALCPCRAPFSVQQLPLCNYRSLISKINHVRQSLQRQSRTFEARIQRLDSGTCSPDIESQVNLAHNMTETMLHAYQKLVKISLKIYAMRTHEHARIDMSANVGNILCHIKALLYNTDMTQTTYQQEMTLERATPGEMFVFTCKGLRESVQVLDTLKIVIENNLLNDVNSFA